MTMAVVDKLDGAPEVATAWENATADRPRKDRTRYELQRNLSVASFKINYSLGQNFRRRRCLSI